MISRREFGIRMGLVVGGIGIAAGEVRAQTIVFNQMQLTLVTRSGSHLFTVDVADTQQKIAMGLRFRHSIPPDGGMIYVLSMLVPAIISTQGLALSTDILFVTQTGRIIEIYPWVLPNSDTPIQARSPVPAVLQLAGGTVARLGISLGDRVLNPMFGQTL